jgi:tRNA nucleotidyltransferase/poly(A) polymerase
MSEVQLARLADLVARHPCRELVALVAGRPCYVVGGAVRDCLLGRPHRDMDLLVDGDGARLARELADRLPGRLVDLGGEAFGSWRVVTAGEEVDLWDSRGTSLEQELARRDLTVNALAVELPAGRLHDPLGALDDLRDGVLRAPRHDSMQADPLRALRLVRLATQLPGFAPDPATRAAARDASPHIADVAGERVREEWLRLQRAADPVAALELLRDVGLYARLWGEADPNAGAGAERTVARLGEAAEDLQASLPAGLPAPDRGVALDLLLLAALPQPATALSRMARRRQRSAAEATRLRRLLSWPALPIRDAAARRFLHQLDDDAATGLLGLGARALAAEERHRWQAALARLAALAAASIEEIRDPPVLLTGEELMHSTGLSGRALGRALDAVREAQVLGTVRTHDQALALVRRLRRLGVWPEA